MTYEQHSLEETNKGEVITGTVKWYSPNKGYGFIQKEMQQEDIFVHFSVLDTANIRHLREGDLVTCEVIRGANGLSAKRILSLSPASLSFRGGKDATTRTAVGEVKWFNSLKGYGFIQSSEIKSDIFFHVSLLQSLGISSLSPGTPVKVTYVEGVRGLEAVSLAFN